MSERGDPWPSSAKTQTSFPTGITQSRTSRLRRWSSSLPWRLRSAPGRFPTTPVSRIDWREGGMLTARPEYLRIRRGKLAFDICAAPFGTGFFFSWWLAELPPSHALLWAILIIVFGFVIFGICVAKFGVLGIFLGPLVILGVLCLLGYLLRDGQSDPMRRTLSWRSLSSAFSTRSSSSHPPTTRSTPGSCFKPLYTLRCSKWSIR